MTRHEIIKLVLFDSGDGSRLDRVLTVDGQRKYKTVITGILITDEPIIPGSGSDEDVLFDGYTVLEGEAEELVGLLRGLLASGQLRFRAPKESAGSVCSFLPKLGEV